MKEIHCVDIPVDGNHKYSHIRLSVDYDIGNSEIAGHERKRGYYLTVGPVYRVDHGDYYTITYSPMDCEKMLLLEVKRKSCRQGEEAERIAVGLMLQWVQWACKKYNLEPKIDVKAWKQECNNEWVKMECKQHF